MKRSCEKIVLPEKHGILDFGCSRILGIKHKAQIIRDAHVYVSPTTNNQEDKFRRVLHLTQIVAHLKVVIPDIFS